jgi:hypothetical protein
LDFTRAFDPDTLGFAYGLAYIHSSKKFSTQLGSGSNDDMRVYINDFSFMTMQLCGKRHQIRM